MEEVKPVTISKNLLTQLPSVDKKTEVEPEQRDVAIEELKLQIEIMQNQISFMASFEANLLQSFDDEIAILKEGSTLTKNDMQKRSFDSIADSLGRIRDRWAKGYQYYIDKKKMSFARKRVADE